MNDTTNPGPLAGLKVLDLSRFVAGPLCAMTLGDLGADVIKIERPGGGDDIRRAPPMVDGESLFVLVFNRNKRSLIIDLKTPRGQQPAQGTGGGGRCSGGEFPPRRDGTIGLRLGRA